MGNMSFSESAKAFAVKQVISYLDKDPDQNIPKVIAWLEKYDKNNYLQKQLGTVKKYINDPDNNWYKLIRSLWTDIDAGQRRVLFNNFVVNGTVIGSPRQDKNAIENDCNVPWAILMDPTSACNLHCTGCWAAEYGNRLNLTLDELEDVIQQGTKLGTYFYIFSGGEPLVRKNDIITLCERHPECMFLAFTNGTLIDEKFADEMLRVKNFVPAISIEGMEEATDSRRGAGTFAKVMRAMDILRERKLAFGTSLCYTRANTDSVGSDEFVDMLIAKGAKFAWIFTYMPIGKDAPTDLIATAEQREYMYHKVRDDWRKTKPFFVLDFWNDGEYSGGCIAGGRCFMHINANGDVEPCAFIHYSDSNIRDKSLLEAYKSPLFMQYHRNQPFNGNMLRPCPLLDNQYKLADMVDASGAHSTDLTDPEDVHDLCAKTKDAADKWEVVADELWGDKVCTSKVKPMDRFKPSEKLEQEEKIEEMPDPEEVNV